MVDILDRIYEVFAEIEKAKKSEDFKMVSEKEEELNFLREELSKASKYKGSYGSSFVVPSRR